MLSLKLRLMLMLDFFMEDMDMVLVWDMPVLDMEVLAMLDMDMALELTDTPDLDIMARDQLMLSLKPRLMLDFSMLDMDMVSQLMDTLDLDITARDLLMLSLRLTLDIFIVDMDILIMVNLYLPSCLKQKLKAISDWQCNIQ